MDIKAAFEAAQRTGQKVYVHCDKWLAHRPEGWEVTILNEFWPDSVGIHGADFPGGWTNYHVPAADCELVPRPFKVGDWVRHANFTTGLVFAVNDGMGIWVGYTTGQSTFYGNTAQSGLTHIDPPEAPHA